MSGTVRCEKGEFYYSCESMLRPGDVREANSGFSDVYEPLPLPYKVAVSQFAEDYDQKELKSLYQRQVTCSTYGNMFLRMHFLHLSKKRIVSDYYQWNLVSWLEERKKSKKEWGEDWWKTIKEDFIAIFKPVCQGLKKMHLMNEYHGNLSMETGIKIQVYDKHVHGILTDMVVQNAVGIGERNGKLDDDIKGLCTIIWNVMKFPFKKDGVPINLSNEVSSLCLSQLKNYSRVNLLAIKWALDPVLFWDVNRRINFLLAVDWMFYGHGKDPYKVLVNNSSFTLWKYDRSSYLLNDVYDFEQKGDHGRRKDPFPSSHSIIHFYRNCIQHVYFNVSQQPNDPAKIHELFMKKLDVLAPSIKTMNNLVNVDFFYSANKPVKVLLESVAKQIEI